MENNRRKTEHIVRLSLFSAIALTIFIVEALLPSPAFFIPGMKLGFANVVTIYLLSCHTKGDAFSVLMVRIFLGSIFAGQIISLAYSLAGGICSFGAMILCRRIFGNEYFWFIGAVGGVFHNIGQICAAALIMKTSAVFSYLPLLVLFGISAGIFCGITASFFVKHTRKIKSFVNTQKKS
ncbi:MAG: Gx transporter family protein [Oscillospiraceae bacterium]|nr:Gx transporter family protein [Oscillospiraceae bacterium]